MMSQTMDSNLVSIRLVLIPPVRSAYLAIPTISFLFIFLFPFLYPMIPRLFQLQVPKALLYHTPTLALQLKSLSLTSSPEIQLFNSSL